jgi:hypothetical protein
MHFKASLSPLWGGDLDPRHLLAAHRRRRSPAGHHLDYDPLCAQARVSLTHAININNNNNNRSILHN